MTVRTVGQHSAPAVAREEEIQRFRRRDQDVRRPARHRGPLARGRIAGPHEDADFRQGFVERLDLPERPLEVLLDVIRKGPQGRDVEDLGGVLEVGAAPHQLAQGPEERGQGLASARGRRDQGMGARGDGGPARALAVRRLAEAIREPAPDGRVEGGKRAQQVIRVSGIRASEVILSHRKRLRRRNGHGSLRVE